MMDAEREERQALMRRLGARQRAALIQSAAFTLLPLVLVATLVTLSVRWVSASEREAAAARVEAAHYQQEMHAGERPTTDLAREVLQYQAEVAARDGQLKAAEEKIARLEQALQSSAQASGDAKKAIDYEAIISQKDKQIAAAREEGRAEGIRSVEQVLAQLRAGEEQARAREKELREQLNALARAKDEEAVARARAEQELKNVQEKAQQDVREARERTAQAESRAAGAERDAAQSGKCCDSVKAADVRREEAVANLNQCQAALKDCERSKQSDTQLEEARRDAANWKTEAANWREKYEACQNDLNNAKRVCEAEVNKYRQEIERLRARLRQFEKETPP
jgi:chromosome segregation ATPase